jgi:hypothetical protein
MSTVLFIHVFSLLLEMESQLIDTQLEGMTSFVKYFFPKSQSNHILPLFDKHGTRRGWLRPRCIYGMHRRGRNGAKTFRTTTLGRMTLDVAVQNVRIKPVVFCVVVLSKVLHSGRSWLEQGILKGEVSLYS